MRVPFWATIFTLLGLLVLCGLGTWQLQRLQWKESLIATWQAEQAKDPLQTVLSSGDMKDGQGLDFKRGAVRGRFLHTREVPLGPRTYKGQAGYHIFTPLEIEGGGTILVNRGWVPQALRDPYSRPESLIGGDMTIGGTFRLPETPNMFVADNRPARNEWYRLDLTQLKDVRKLPDLAPVTLYAENAPQSGPYPAMDAILWKPRNNHLAYALFWFSMAGILAVVYGLRFFRGSFRR